MGHKAKWCLKSAWYRPQTLHQLGKLECYEGRIADQYARWLAALQGVDLSKATHFELVYTWNGLTGYARGWCESVRYFTGSRNWYGTREWNGEFLCEVKIPHSDFDPASIEAFSYIDVDAAVSDLLAA